MEWEIYNPKTHERTGFVWCSNKYADALEIARDYQGDSVDVRLKPGIERKYDDAIDYVNHLRDERIKSGGPWTREDDAYLIHLYTSDLAEF